MSGVHLTRRHPFQDDIIKLMMLDICCYSYPLSNHVTLNSVKSL
jgi:hypothetical protein